MPGLSGRSPRLRPRWRRYGYYGGHHRRDRRHPYRRHHYVHPGSFPKYGGVYPMNRDSHASFHNADFTSAVTWILASASSAVPRSGRCTWRTPCPRNGISTSVPSSIRQVRSESPRNNSQLKLVLIQDSPEIRILAWVFFTRVKVKLRYLAARLLRRLKADSSEPLSSPPIPWAIRNLRTLARTDGGASYTCTYLLRVSRTRVPLGTDPKKAGKAGCRNIAASSFARPRSGRYRGQPAQSVHSVPRR